MIYYVLVTIVVTAVGLLIYTILFDRKFFGGLLVTLVICTGFLSCYTSYYIGSYRSTDSDMILNVNIESSGDENYKLVIDNKWRKKPQIFGFNGNDDLLAVRYRPDMCEILSADADYTQGQLGKTSIKMPNDYIYSKISKKEREIYFYIEDGVDTRITLALEDLGPGEEIKVFYIHDFKVPLVTSRYWEKHESVKL